MYHIADNALPKAQYAYCTTKEAAERLGVSLRTVQLWVEQGKLDAWKTGGGHRRISVRSVDKMLAARQPITPPPSRRIKVLVAEDDHMLLKLYKMRMSDWHLPIEVITCANAYDALMLIGREAPDILIADLAMPGLDGQKMLQTLCVSPYREGMEIVAVSGLPPDEVIARGGLPEQVPLLPKPVPFEALREICVRHLTLCELL